ncbi:MAG: methionine--tRNA ligase subunit beta [Patescibacteria group bacterium]|nr:methionine--tRNA ligase subunit beta [Patescibacteria group bacterium]
MTNDSPMIPFSDFQKVELRVAKILSAERVEKSEKLLKLQLDAGDKDAAGLPAVRQVIAGIGKVYDPAALAGREIVIVANLEPRMLMGLESNGMLLAPSDENGPAFLMPEREVPPGAEIH